MQVKLILGISLLFTTYAGACELEIACEAGQIAYGNATCEEASELDLPQMECSDEGDRFVWSWIFDASGALMSSMARISPKLPDSPLPEPIMPLPFPIPKPMFQLSDNLQLQLLDLNKRRLEDNQRLHDEWERRRSWGLEDPIFPPPQSGPNGVQTL